MNVTDYYTDAEVKEAHEKSLLNVVTTPLDYAMLQADFHTGQTQLKWINTFIRLYNTHKRRYGREVYYERQLDVLKTKKRY